MIKYETRLGNPHPIHIAGWSSPAAREAHNLEVVGSNPTPATFSRGLPPLTGGNPSLFPLINNQSNYFFIDRKRAEKPLLKFPGRQILLEGIRGGGAKK